MMPGNIDWPDEMDAVADAAWSEIAVDVLPETGDQNQMTEEPTAQ